mgnify:CR=1 FL=1
MQNQWNHKIFNVEKEGFEALALEIFCFQYENNLIYKAYVDVLLPDITAIDSINKIPFLPVRFFKSLKVATTDFEPQTMHCRFVAFLPRKRQFLSGIYGQQTN